MSNSGFPNSKLSIDIIHFFVKTDNVCSEAFISIGLIYFGRIFNIGPIA